MLTLEMLDQLWLGPELAGAVHQVAGEAVRLELVGLQSLQVRELGSTVAAENSGQLRVGGRAVVTPADVAGQL